MCLEESVLRLSAEWNNCSFGTVDVDTITKKVAEYNKAKPGDLVLG